MQKAYRPHVFERAFWYINILMLIIVLLTYFTGRRRTEQNQIYFDQESGKVIIVDKFGRVQVVEDD